MSQPPQTTQALAVRSTVAGLARATYSREDIDLLKQTVCPGATDQQLDLLVSFGKIRGLDLIAKQYYGIIRKVYNKEKSQPGKPHYDHVMTIQTGVDGFRLMAQRSGEYEGQEPPEWCDKDLVWKEVWTEDYPPFACRVGVMRKGFRKPLYAVCRFSSYAQYFTKDNNKKFLMGLWETMPDNQIEKCCEVKALRKAFPQELGNVYIPEEAHLFEQPEGVIMGEVVDEEETAPAPATGPDKKAKEYKHTIVGQPKLVKQAPPQQATQNPEEAKLSKARQAVWIVANQLWPDRPQEALSNYTQGASLKEATEEQCKAWHKELSEMHTEMQAEKKKAEEKAEEDARDAEQAEIDGVSL